MVKRIALFGVCGLLVLLVLGAGYMVLTNDERNARIVAEMRADPEGARAARTMLITLASGQMYPVNYLHEGNVVFMGIDGRWWREFLGDGQPVTLWIKGESYEGHARTVIDNQAYTNEVFKRLRPTAPAWLPDWLNGKLVVITLQDG